MGAKYIDKGLGQLLAGLFLASGIVAAAYLLSCAVKDFKAADRYVTVKGLVEKEVRADMGLWTIKFRVSGDDLSSTQSEAASQKEIVASFLKDAGIASEDIKSTFRVIDKKAQEYGQNQSDAMRFIIEVSTQVRSLNVDMLETASQKTESLVGQASFLRMILAERDRSILSRSLTKSNRKCWQKRRKMPAARQSNLQQTAAARLAASVVQIRVFSR